jgi:hypothetical protein
METGVNYWAVVYGTVETEKATVCFPKEVRRGEAVRAPQREP